MGATKPEYICRSLMACGETTVDAVRDHVSSEFGVDVYPYQIREVIEDLDEMGLIDRFGFEPERVTLLAGQESIFTSEACVGDDHPLTEQAAAYATEVINGDEYPLARVDLCKVEFRTSSRTKQRHGVHQSGRDGNSVIRLSEKTHERGGWTETKETIRHELVHVWQRQTDGVEPGHMNDFRIWIDAMELSGRCSTAYENTRDDYNYVYKCPECEQWFGKHRLCKSIRQAAEGGSGSVGYRYCNSCEVKLYLVRENGSGDEALPHQTYSDETIKRFAKGESIDVNARKLTEVEVEEV